MNFDQWSFDNTKIKFSILMFSFKVVTNILLSINFINIELEVLKIKKVFKYSDEYFRTVSQGCKKENFSENMKLYKKFS